MSIISITIILEIEYFSLIIIEECFCERELTRSRISYTCTSSLCDREISDSMYFYRLIISITDITRIESSCHGSHEKCGLLISLICIEFAFWIRVRKSIITRTEIYICTTLEDIWTLCSHDIEIRRVRLILSKGSQESHTTHNSIIK